MVQTTAYFCMHNVVDEIAEIYSLMVSVKQLYFSGRKKLIRKKKKFPLGLFPNQPMSSYGRSRVTHQHIH